LGRKGKESNMGIKWEESTKRKERKVIREQVVGNTGTKPRREKVRKSQTT